MPAQKTGDGLGQGVLCFSHGQVVLLAEEDHAAQHVPLGQNGRGGGDDVALRVVAHGQRGLAGLMLVDLPALHDLGQGGGDALVGQLPPAAAGDGEAGVPVGDGDELARALVQGLAQLAGEIRQAAHEGVFLKHDAALAVGEDLQGVPLPDAHGAADLLGDDHPAQVVPLCQVGAKKFYKLSEKPLISMTLGFPDGATMHLRGFDRLCYFRSKFDRFAPK